MLAPIGTDPTDTDPRVAPLSQWLILLTLPFRLIISKQSNHLHALRSNIGTNRLLQLLRGRGLAQCFAVQVDLLLLYVIQAMHAIT